jgi:hypothetical protein
VDKQRSTNKNASSVQNVAVLLADNTFVLAAFHLLLLFVAIHYWTVIAVFFCLISV